LPDICSTEIGTPTITEPEGTPAGKAAFEIAANYDIVITPANVEEETPEK
jgi:hypothetical protein